MGHGQSPLCVCQSVTIQSPSTHRAIHLLPHPSVCPPSHLPFSHLVPYLSPLSHPSALRPWITLLTLLLCLLLCSPNSLPPCSRIYEILPQRIQQWQQSPCIAEEHGKKLLERIRREQQSARTRLQEMERRFHELEAIILRAKQQAVREDEEVSGHGCSSGAGPSTCSRLASSSPPPRAEQ